MTAIQALLSLAPLHNPVNLAGTSVARVRRPDVHGKLEVATQTTSVLVVPGRCKRHFHYGPRGE